MRKIIVLLVTVVLTATILSACSMGNETPTDENTFDYASYFATDENTQPQVTDAQSRASYHQEYVETYYIYAEQGAVVTWFDSQTGEFNYKEKCESCGWTSGGEHTGGSLGPRASYTSSFTCQNHDCIMWGSPQPLRISCNVSSEWVDVVD